MYFDPSRYAEWPGSHIKKQGKKTLKFPRVCATCRHLEIGETGREFPAIIDSEYTVFRCKILKWETKEFYLMKSVGDIMEDAAYHEECPYWEPWTEDEIFEEGEESP
ncbi:MAG: hypothetical protein J7M18_08610 [Candidatus Eremiobacteraeota bacterium]|nr:hypothetical protein [Candidatus Eremiobacteraeota bacterium]